MGFDDASLDVMQSAAWERWLKVSFTRLILKYSFQQLREEKKKKEKDFAHSEQQKARKLGLIYEHNNGTRRRSR